MDYNVLSIAPGLEVLIAPLASGETALHPDEESALGNVPEKRRLEFAAGRNLARNAMSRLGAKPAAIPRRDRAPVWPDGFVGSVSHTKALVAACVARREQFAGVGVDIELKSRVTARIERKILTEEETREQAAAGTLADASTIRFACKEAIYKAVHPIVGVYFGFQAVTVKLNPDEGTFEGVPMEDGAFAASVAHGTGRFLETDGHRLAAFYLDA